MATIIKYQHHVVNAEAFVRNFGTSGNDLMYMGISKSTAWGGGDANPDAVADNIDAEDSFWTDLIGMEKVSISNVMLAIPRIDWAQGVAFAPISTSSLTPYSDAPGSYVYVNDEGNHNVYKCLTNNGVTGATAPSGQTSSTITTPDGFQWKYMYTLTPTEVSDVMQDTWLPVAAHNVVEPQLSSGDALAYKNLGARYAIVNIKLTKPSLGGLPAVSYRKVSLVSNPDDNLGAPLTGGVVLAAGISSAASGQIVHLEHKSPITRLDEQEETMTIIFEF